MSSAQDRSHETITSVIDQASERGVIRPADGSTEVVVEAPARRQRRVRFTKRTFRALTPWRLERFLQAVATGSELAEASEFADVAIESVNRLAKRDPTVAEALREAKEIGAEYLIQEAHRRAIDGWEEPIFYRGAIVGWKRVYDSHLLVRLLQARRPAEFGDKQTLVVGGVSALTADELKAARQLGQDEGVVAALELVAGAFATYSRREPEQAQLPAPPDIEGEVAQ